MNKRIVSIIKPGSTILHLALGFLASGIIIACVFIFTYIDTRMSVDVEKIMLDKYPRLELVSKLDRMQATYVFNGKIYGVEERSVYVSDDGGKTFRILGYLPRSAREHNTFKIWIKNLLAKNEITRRLRRSEGPASMIVLKSGTILVISDKVYRKGYDDDQFKIISQDEAYLHPFQSGRAMTVGPDDTVYYGEYTKGPHHSTIKILRGEDDGRTWSVAYTFPQDMIYHVHSIVWDQYRKRYWVTTGDADKESYILYTDDEFRTLTTLGGGSQDWRAVALLVREDQLVWGSDNGRNSSSIFSWNFASSQLVELVEIGNPASYVASLPNGTLLVSTTYIPRTEYGQSKNAVPEAALWASIDGSSWAKVYALPAAKDLTGDKRPQIRLPGGDESLPFAFATPLYTKPHNFSILKLKFNWD